MFSLIKSKIFNSLTDRLSEFIIITDLEGHILNVNAPFLRLLNCSKEELIGKSFKELFGLKKNIFETMQFYKPVNNCLFYRNKKYPLLMSSTILFNDNEIPFALQIIGNDAMECDLPEEAIEFGLHVRKLKDTLKKQEEDTTTKLSFLSDALASVGESVFIVDKTQNIIYCNRMGMETFGYTWGELIGKPTRFLYESADEISFVGNWKGEVIATKKNGETFHSLLTTSTVNNKEGVEIGVVGVFRDISKLKNLVEELEKAGAELEERVKLRTEELEKSRAQLLHSSKMAAIGTLAAGIAHELNNPLTIIIGNCHLLRSDPDCTENIKIRLQKIYDQCERAKKITYNLSIFSRAHKTEKKNVNLLELMEKILELRSYEISVNNIFIIKEFDENLPSVYVDEYQIQQVFFNLLNNAVDAILEVRNRGEIKIKIKKENNVIRVIVSDNGTGIDEENIKKLFDPFYTTKEVGKGTGLGLSISYGIIKAHNGEITVKSQPGRGTDFIIELPLVLADN